MAKLLEWIAAMFALLVLLSPLVALGWFLTDIVAR
jgi:hypothetical protein